MDKHAELFSGSKISSSGSSGSRSLAPAIARINVFPTDADKGRQISKVSQQFLALNCIWMHIRDAW